MLRGGLGALFGLGRQARPLPDSLVYAVGDVHGRFDLLMELVEAVLEDAARVGEGSDIPEIVFLGDYVDRGPDTCSTLEFLMTMQEWPEIQPIFLVGNHELMLLDFLRDPVMHWSWLRNGGISTMDSYGIHGSAEIVNPDLLLAAAADLREAMGPHVDFLNRLTPWHRNGNLLFVHAGANPRVAPEYQPIEALVWGTETARRRKDGLWVVHGHFIVDRPEAARGRIAIDTGAWLTGRLTAMRARRGGVAFLTTHGPPESSHGGS